MKKILLLTVVILSIILCSCTQTNEESINCSLDNNLFTVHFIDVGQGDSTLLVSPDNKSMLIDAGDNSHGKKVVNYLNKLNIKKIDILIGTHPDADHIGGLDYVINHFDIGLFYMPDKTHNTNTFKDVLLAAKNFKPSSFPLANFFSDSLAFLVELNLATTDLRSFSSINNVESLTSL